MKNPESLIGRQNKIIQYMFKALDYCKAFPDSKYHCEMAIQQYMAFKRECLPEETQLVYEDQLPKMSDEQYSEWFNKSKIVDGVRMGPPVSEETNSPNKAMTAAEFCKQYDSQAKNLLKGVNDPLLHRMMDEYHSQQSQAEQKELVEMKRKVEKLTKQLSISVSLDVLKEVLAAEKEKSAKLVEALNKTKNWLNNRVPVKYVNIHPGMNIINEALKEYEAK
jgi:hypothetical protein